MDRKKILVVTSSDEPNVGKVLPYLLAGGAEVIRLDTDRLLEEKIRITHRIAKGELWWGVVEDGVVRVSLDDVYSVWYRRPATPRSPSFANQKYSEFIVNETSKFLWCLWTSNQLRSVLTLNSPLALRLLEFNKPYQLAVASAVGLEIPESIITTDATVALDFCDRWNDEIVAKVFGGYPLVTEDRKNIAIYTNRVRRANLVTAKSEFQCMPVFLENYIPKAFELRITVVGKQVFSCRINSQDSERTRDDWRRYDFSNVRHAPYELPGDVREKLLAFMRAVGIEFGAIDMIVTPDGRHVFLEVNPSGQWAWIERLTGLPISRTIAEILLDHSLCIGSYPDYAVPVHVAELL